MNTVTKVIAGLRLFAIRALLPAIFQRITWHDLTGTDKEERREYNDLKQFHDVGLF
jgi:hypothetical protein